MKKLVLAALVLVGSASMALAADAPAAAPAKAAKPAAKAMHHAHHAMAPAEHVIMTPDDMKWTDAPPVLPAGAQLAVLAGNPNGAGMYTLRLKLPDGYKIMPHMHPTPEQLTVLEGTFNVGMGKTFDDSNGKAVPTGGFGIMPAHEAHYAWTTGETVIEFHGMGPFALKYVDPKDDPSKAAAKSGD
ncbi:MAG TPA: cupin domain-containing protein [Candidatus Eisenbacteria bacterium]|nr:cupin domain-containing protein [Candidatus Eisenbacteria bacterium]